jgi:DNA-binding MarR family transcriptional regulator
MDGSEGTPVAAAMDLNDQLGYNLYRAALLFRRELIRALRDYDLTPEQWQTLASLWASGPMTPTEIGRVTLQDISSISRMLSRMEKRRWIERVADAEDGRSFRVAVTAEGSRLRTVLVPLLVDHFDGMLAEFDEPRQRRMLKLLKELRKSFGDAL